MIQLFKMIRQQLLSESKFRKYLVYALGEIILVVIGILIAVSINNWNDYRKDRIAEKELYRTLIRSLENDLRDVQDKYTVIDSAILGQELFITRTIDQVVSQHSADAFFHILDQVANTSRSFVPNISLYNKISQNKQIDLIRSEALQMKIIELYEVHYWEYKDLDNTLEGMAQNGLVSNFFGSIAHLIIDQKMSYDADQLRTYYEDLNKECRKIYFLSQTTKRSMLNCEKNIVSVLELLNNELNG